MNTKRLSVLSSLFMILSFSTVKAQTLFLGQILFVPFDFNPKGTLPCNGSLLPIQPNSALFSLIGTKYGGNGISNFAIPNAQGRVFVGAGKNTETGTQFDVGEIAGTESVTLTIRELPEHKHAVPVINTSGNTSSPQNAIHANTKVLDKEYANVTSANTSMNVQSVTETGKNEPHNNMMPYLALKCIIVTQGAYPSIN